MSRCVEAVRQACTCIAGSLRWLACPRRVYDASRAGGGPTDPSRAPDRPRGKASFVRGGVGQAHGLRWHGVRTVEVTCRQELIYCVFQSGI